MMKIVLNSGINRVKRPANRAALEALESRTFLSAVALGPRTNSTASFTPTTGLHANQTSRKSEPSKPAKVGGAGSASPGIAGIDGPQIHASFKGVAYEPSVYQYSATVDWSNGSQTAASLTFEPDDMVDVTVESPVFQRPGRYTADVRLIRNGQLVGQVRVPFKITLNSPTGVSINVTAGRPFSRRLGTFEADTVEFLVTGVTIDWGDGTTSPGTFQAISGMELSPGNIASNDLARGSHTYAKPGRYRIEVFATTIFAKTSLIVDDTAIVAKAARG
jgi:hypothetical protein